LLSSSLFLSGIESVAASPDQAKWSIVDTPSEEGAVVVSPSEINTLAIGSDDETFYAIDIPNGKVYKSIDGGVTWDDLTATLNATGAKLPAWDIAVTPGNPEILAVVTDNRTAVYASDDGGETWVDANVPDLGGLLIADIAISEEYADSRDIAIGTRKPDATVNGDVWVRELESLGTWKAQGLDLDVTTVRFSPSYSSDKTILVIASDADKTYLCTGVRNTFEDTTDWDVTDPNQVEISESSGESPGENEIIVSDLALPSDYSGEDADTRVVYAAYSSNTTADDVYRINDDVVYRMNVNHGEDVAIATIAYNGTCNGSKLLAGEVESKSNSADAQIHMCFNPGEYFPDWEKPSKPPTGGVVSQRANAQVAWSSDAELAYCGTSTNYVESAADWADMALPDGPWRGSDPDDNEWDESAFSQSQDEGDTWNQLSLIDTKISRLSDFALSTNYDVLYLASIGYDFDSIWRSENELLGETWERILCPRHEGDIILRHSPEEDARGEAIFFAIIDTDDAYYSLNRGQTWERVWDCPDITDLAVVNDELFYILDDNLVYKCWWDEESWGGIWDWQRDVDTGLRSGYSIAVSGEDFVFVGEGVDCGGRIAYSADGGASFELTEVLPEPGKIKVIPDEDFNRNRFIYAASGVCEIFRWTIGSSVSWEELKPPCPGAVYDLTQKGGALYGAYGPGVDRTLIPHEETVTTDDWDRLELGLEAYVEFKPGTLRSMYNEDDETIDLWAIDDNRYFNGDISQYDDPDYNAVGRLWVYSDAFALRTPWPTSPALGGFLPCDICACQAEVFCFRWQQLPLAEEYELWIALDEEFSIILLKEEDIAPPDCCNPAWCPPKDSFRLTCGKTYYWKVRSSKSIEGDRIHSRWSPPMEFTVQICSSLGEMHVAPILEVPQSGSRNTARSPSFSWIGFPDTTEYEFILAEDADLTQVIIREELPAPAYRYTAKLDWGKTYFWQVRALEPAPSEPATATFTVMSKPVTAPTPPAAPATPFWIWLAIGILALLVVVVIVFSLTTRR
jgi:photosystem II stability/assembly factor-like uncharacterized protein